MLVSSNIGDQGQNGCASNDHDPNSMDYSSRQQSNGATGKKYKLLLTCVVCEGDAHGTIMFVFERKLCSVSRSLPRLQFRCYNLRVVQGILSSKRSTTSGSYPPFRARSSLTVVSRANSNAATMANVKLPSIGRDGVRNADWKNAFTLVQSCRSREIQQGDDALLLFRHA